MQKSRNQGQRPSWLRQRLADGCIDFLYRVSIAAIGDHVDEVEGRYPELVESGDDPEDLRHARIGRDESRTRPMSPWNDTTTSDPTTAPSP